MTPKTSLKIKEGELELPEFYDTVKTLAQTVDVDYFLSSCPPPVPLIIQAVEAIFNNKLPPKGSVLMPNKSVCDEYPKEKKDKHFSEIKRIYEIDDDEKTCFWDQGAGCMGPATRAGCDAKCPNINVPCTGGGPGPRVTDQGAAAVSALASIATNPEVINLVHGVSRLGWQEMILIFTILLLVFGPTKLPKIARELGKAWNEFNKASSGVIETISSAQTTKNKDENKLLLEIAKTLCEYRKKKRKSK